MLVPTVLTDSNLSVGFTSGPHIKGVILSVRRIYRDMPNKYGGRGVSVPLLGDREVFPDHESAEAFALAGGYIRRR